MAIKLKNSVTVPGFHLHPQWDLPGLRKRNQKKEGKDLVSELPLVSLIDMFTILVIFLLMNFSATGEVFFLQRELKLPAAKYAKPIEAAPLVTITPQEVILDVERVGKNPLTITESNQDLPRLTEALRFLKNQVSEEHPGLPFKGAINVQADETTPLIFIKRVMRTCISEGWTSINFAVRLPNDKPLAHQH